jgi:hypothetical protein
MVVLMHFAQRVKFVVVGEVHAADVFLRIVLS